MGKKEKSSKSSKRSRRGKGRKKVKIGKDYPQEKEIFAISVMDGLEQATDECKRAVERIVEECKATNRKFRDFDFDLERDRDICLHGIYKRNPYNPSNVQRVNELFKYPQFFVGQFGASDIVQGSIGDSWFISALATMSTVEAVLERCCPARDEEAGVYGFIFFRDLRWEVVIIDDFLYTTIPKFEELDASERELYHNDKQTYNNSIKKNGKSLYFGRSAKDGETWVSLIEKAYAKLYGCYYALHGGYSNEAIEDLTGGVSTYIAVRDIFDTDRFWREELLQTNDDRLLDCSYKALDSTVDSADDGGDLDVTKLYRTVDGHSYPVVRAIEHKGKRFVVLRNPWGKEGWAGSTWADSSKEWTSEWLEALPVLVFGDDGQFVVEYQDFLDCWDHINRNLLLDSTWVMSCQWLHVRVKTPFHAGSYGNVSFMFTLPKSSPTVLVLSQANIRYFEAISGRCAWSIDFVLFKAGQKTPIRRSSHARPESRSVNLEIELEPGEYVVHVRLDRREVREPGYNKNIKDGQSRRATYRVLREMTRAHSLAANLDSKPEGKRSPQSLSEFAGRSLAKAESDDEAAESTDEETSSEEEDEEEEYEVSDLDSVFLGLKVYSQKDAPASVSGQLSRRLQKQSV
ncbi:hypothetical protein VNI00_004177 [Paramarasmius palmivorus]|uniref:Calpain catalytic domain-containing protein n=1 Tax=Paramarasmius palmivorus TaxID=297713 RepID=A0AAW0DMX0_9AGAR